MDLSMKWLKDYVTIDAKPREFAHAMTMSGSKVEGYEIEGEEIENVVVGKVLDIKAHADSDHLVICQIDVAKEAPLQIVTGANNVVVGALVPVAMDNSTLPGGKKIKKGKLRGELSEGMLCSLSELGLTINDFPYAIEDGIFLIEEDCKIGEDICTALGFNDTCVEFEITPNRPDCLSVIGLAREASATYNVPLTLHTPVIKYASGNINDLLKVEVLNKELCPRYTARMIKNVKIAPSPRWMRERLRASGIRPINNLVDITNYVMLEYGQPLHAFDASLLDGKKIIVRNAQKGEKFKTLDNVDRVLNETMLVIADEKKAVAVAGVMGGENSAIVDGTNTVIFESANFKGSCVRVTARDLSLRTDASGRFEKGLDAKSTMPAVMRACELVELLGVGEVIDGIIDIDNSPTESVKIKLEVEWINAFLGINATREDMVTILTSLCFKMDGDDIIVPSYRADVEHKADIAEEIARIYGYDKIPTTAVKGVAKGKLTPEQKFERIIHKTLQSSGCYEVSTYSFISPKYYDNINLPSDSSLRNCVKITNPLGEETSVMRTTTLPSMLEVLSKNFNNRNSTFYGYEIANEYIPNGENELPNENPQVTVGMYGENADFYKLKGIVEIMLTRLNIKGWDIHAVNDDPSFHPGRCAVITIGDTTLGILGEAHPIVIENYSIGSKVYLAKFDVKAMFLHCETEIQYKALPKYPSSTRDLSLICDIDLPIIEIEKAIRSAVGNILEDVKLFDVYKGAQIAEDKKSVSYSIVMRSQTGTLTDVEADTAMKRVLKALEKINVILRA
ncbi:MAG: phenylalanine--tRNA ligase subunit beta [Oscillospiraceae bacterium]